MAKAVSKSVAARRKSAAPKRTTPRTTTPKLAAPTTKAVESATPAPAVAACRGCAAPLSGRYCAACGLDSRSHRRRWGELVQEFIETFFEIAVNAPRTLMALLIRPQELAIALRDGDHRYPTPFRLYVTASAIFFLFLAATGVTVFQMKVVRLGGEPITQVTNGRVTGVYGYRLEEQFLHPRADAPRDLTIVRALSRARDQVNNAIDRTGLELIRKIADDPEWMNEDVERWAPRALWLLMPIYALLLWPLFYRAPYLSDHFIFAVWAHTTMYLLLIMGSLINIAGFGRGLTMAFVAYQTYLSIGLKAYYGASWIGAILKGALHTTLYLLLCWFPVIAAFFWLQIVSISPELAP